MVCSLAASQDFNIIFKGIIFKKEPRQKRCRSGTVECKGGVRLPHPSDSGSPCDEGQARLKHEQRFRTEFCE